MRNAIKYTLVFLLIRLFTELPMMIVSHFTNVDRAMLSLIASGIASILIGIYVVRQGEVRIQKESFSVKSWTIFIPCLMILIFFSFPQVELDKVLNLPDWRSERIHEMSSTIPGLIIIGIVAPIAEEFLFRGAVLKSLLEWKKISGKPWLAILLSAILFALAHRNPAQIPAAFLFGLLFGWLFFRTRSLLPGIVLHIIHNSYICAAALSQKYLQINVPQTTSGTLHSPGPDYLSMCIFLVFLAASLIFLVRLINKYYPLPAPKL